LKNGSLISYRFGVSRSRYSVPSTLLFIGGTASFPLLVEPIDKAAVVDLSEIMEIPSLERTNEVHLGIMGDLEIIYIPHRKRMRIWLIA